MGGRVGASLLLVVFASCGPTVRMGRGNRVRSDHRKRSYVVLLGTGTPNANPVKHGPSTAVVVRGVPYIVDCGPGIVRRASAAFRAGAKALGMSRLNTLFLTHLHSDHTVGYPDLIFTPWVLGRKRPFRVFGPKGTAEMTRHILAAYREDVKVRLEGLEPANDRGHRVTAAEVGPGVVYRDRRITVRAFKARHGAWKESFGYRLSTPDMDVCISGDTAPYPEMTTNYARCDILIHEVFSNAGLKRRPPRWRAYHRSGHTSAKDLAAVARRVKPGLLVLIHQLQWGTSDPDLVKEVKAGYGGKVLYGRDLTFIGLKPGFSGYRSGGPSAGGFVVFDLLAGVRTGRRPGP